MHKKNSISYSVFSQPPNCNARKKQAMIGLKKRVFVEAIVRFGLDNSDFPSSAALCCCAAHDRVV